MPVLSTSIVLDCFHLLIFYSGKFSTDVCRLPYAVNVNLSLSITWIGTEQFQNTRPHHLHLSERFKRTSYDTIGTFVIQ